MVPFDVVAGGDCVISNSGGVRVSQNEDRRPKTSLILGLSNSRQLYLAIVLCRTLSHARRTGLSFCRKDRVKLQNEDPHSNALSDAKRRETDGVFVL